MTPAVARTGRPDVEPASPRAPRYRLRLALVGAVAAACLAVLATAGLGDALVYYRTPSEVADAPPGPDERLRLGGLVARGSVQRDGGRTSFTVTDGVASVPVVYAGEPPGVFSEGQGAVVEGWLGPDGVLVGDAILVKHNNEYRPRSSAGDAT